MKVQILTVVVGTTACNANCPYCVSQMTPSCNVDSCHPKINKRNFDISCEFAKQSGVSTVLLTGKGEPTLYPDHVTDYVYMSSKHGFPFIELQTNGIEFLKNPEMYKEYLKLWYNGGMTTISVSMAHYLIQKNDEIFSPNSNLSYNQWDIVDMIHDAGMSVRVNCTMCIGYIDSWKDIKMFMEVCKEHDVEQTTFRPVTKPDDSENKEVSDWVDDYALWDGVQDIIINDASCNCTKLLELGHGATVYDYKGQNLCISNCLTSSKDPENIRQLIFFPDGHLRFDWKYEGAIIF